MKRLFATFALISTIMLAACNPGTESTSAASTAPEATPTAATAPQGAAEKGSAEVGLIITNARVIDGTGNVIEQGSVVVQDGKIVSVGETASPLPGALEINAGGLSSTKRFAAGYA